MEPMGREKFNGKDESLMTTAKWKRTVHIGGRRRGIGRRWLKKESGGESACMGWKRVETMLSARIKTGWWRSGRIAGCPRSCVAATKYLRRDKNALKPIRQLNAASFLLPCPYCVHNRRVPPRTNDPAPANAATELAYTGYRAVRRQKSRPNYGYTKDTPFRGIVVECDEETEEETGFAFLNARIGKRK